MSDICFRVQGTKAYVICNGKEKQVPRESILEICQLVIGHIAPNRDYTSVTSVGKLMRIIDLECEPDDSDNESEKVEDDEKPATKKPSTKAVARKPAVRTVRRTPAKPAPKDSDKDSDNDSEDNGSDEE